MREPLPEFIEAFLDKGECSEGDLEADFYLLLARLCRLRANTDHIRPAPDETMAQEAQRLINEFLAWAPQVDNWDPNHRPVSSIDTLQSSNDIYHSLWRTNIWLMKHTAAVLASEIVIERAKFRSSTSSSGSLLTTLTEATRTQKALCLELMNSTVYYLDKFRNTQVQTRTLGGYGLLWPIYVLSTSSTSTLETMIWTTEQSDKVAEAFGLKQAKVMANFLRGYTQES